MSRWLLVLLLAACKSSAPDDCKIVTDDPTHAMARISERHPGNAVLASETIERCLAPTGDDCERLTKILPALPKMMGATPYVGDVAALCKDMTPEMRRCLFPSYALMHGGDCASLPIDKIDIKPRPLQDRPVVRSDEPADFSLAIDREGVTVTSKRNGVHHKAGALDPVWLETELRAAKDPDRSDLELKVGPGLPYQTAVSAMDIAVKVGFIDVGLDSGSAAEATPNPRGSDALANAPAVIITKYELTAAGKRIASVDELAKGSSPIEALAAAMPRTGQLAILQADESTDMNVINRVVNTLKGAGYDNIMFAVKNR